MTPKQIVILGAGFGGIRTAKALAAANPKLQITIIDQYPHHTIHGQLYEVATSPDELVDLTELKTSVEIPLSEIFLDTNVAVFTAKVEHVDLAANTLTAGGRTIHYDYLISALGAGPNFFSIPGAKEFTLPFGSSFDALRIRSAIEGSVALAKNSPKRNQVNIMIAGGGVGGVEIAAELHGMLDYLSWRENFLREKLQVTIIERNEKLLSVFPEPVIRAATKRLTELDTKFQLGTAIQSITQHVVVTDKGEFDYDVLVWSAGVRANLLPTNQELPVKKGDRIEVDEYFRLKQFSNVYILGDQCCWVDTDGVPLPGTASQALHQAEYVAKAVLAQTKNQTPPNFSCKSFPYLIPLGPKWAIFSYGNKVIKGYLAYLIRQLVWWRYYISILGFKEGTHWLLRTTELFKRND